MLNLDTLAAILMAAVVLLAVWVICRTAPGAGPAWLARRRRATAYHRAGGRHAPPRKHGRDATTPMPALTTVPDSIAPLVRTI